MESQIDNMYFERYFITVLTFAIMVALSLMLSVLNRNDTDVPWKTVFEKPDAVILPGRLGMRNLQWKLYDDKQSQEDIASFFYKKGTEVQKLDETMLHEVIVSQMHYHRRGVYFISGSGHGKFSYINNFLCAGSHVEKFPICNKIIFYHMCSIDNERRSNHVYFIKRISRNILSVFPGIGYEMYFDQHFEKHLYGSWCSLYPDECIEQLIVKPLREYFKVKSNRRYLICVELLDECAVTGYRKEWNIIRVLRILIKTLPNEVYFIFTSRLLKHKFEELGLITLDGMFTIYGNMISIGPCIEGLTCRNSEDFIGYCVDSTQIVSQLALIWVMSYWELRSATRRLWIIVFCVLCVHSILIITPPVTSVLLMVIWCYEIRLYFKKKPKTVEFMTKSWFFKLEIRCDNIDINCIIDERLERKYATFGSVLQRNYPGESDVTITSKEQLGKLNQDSMCDFELAYAVKNDETLKNDSMLNKRLMKAATQKQTLLCRWILINLNDKGLANHYIDKALNIAFINQDKDTAKALAWVITKTFYQRYARMFTTITDIYPAIRCHCKRKGILTEALCSRDKLLIVTTDDYIPGFPEVFRTFQIYVSKKSKEKSRRIGENDEILRELSKFYTDSFCLKTSVSSKMAENVFLHHSNLGLICPCVVKSVGFKTLHFQVKHEISIQLHCKKKGILPIGESHFPEYIGGIMTDVLEGQPELISNLRIGTKIGPTTSQGTLGGFIKYLDIDCFLTCAHVMYDLESLIDADITSLKGSTAYLHSPFGLTEVGKVIRRVFNHSDSLKTSIDAAIVALVNNATIDPNDYVLDQNGVRCNFSQLGLSSQYLNDSCLNYEEFCTKQQIQQQCATVVSLGAMTAVKANIQFNHWKSNKDVHFTPTGPAAASVNNQTFFPLWLGQPAHMQLSSRYSQGSRLFRMYNQMALNIPLIAGDSGSCVYVIQHPTTNGCIGMAIAMCGSITLVTPLKEILKTVNT